MEFVEPIKNKDDIQRMKDYLLKQSYRNYFMFTLGINVGFSIKNLLSLKVRDLREKDHMGNYYIKDVICVDNKKFPIIPELVVEITKYVNGMEDDEYLFKSNKGKNKPITTDRAYIIIRDAGNALGIPRLGSHSLRKTFGYWHYQRNKDLSLLMNLFNLPSLKVTAKYLSLDVDYKRESLKGGYL